MRPVRTIVQKLPANRQIHPADRIIDVNLRQDFYDYSTLRRGCALARVLKLNHTELEILADMLDLRGASVEAMVGRVFEKFPLEYVLSILSENPRARAPGRRLCFCTDIRTACGEEGKISCRGACWIDGPSAGTLRSPFLNRGMDDRVDRRISVALSANAPFHLSSPSSQLRGKVREEKS